MELRVIMSTCSCADLLSCAVCATAPQSYCCHRQTRFPRPSHTSKVIPATTPVSFSMFPAGQGERLVVLGGTQEAPLRMHLSKEAKQLFRTIFNANPYPSTSTHRQALNYSLPHGRLLTCYA
eukprot:6194322-Pleurochrysis_carterae.AAC.4